MIYIQILLLHSFLSAMFFFADFKCSKLSFVSVLLLCCNLLFIHFYFALCSFFQFRLRRSDSLSFLLESKMPIIHTEILIKSYAFHNSLHHLCDYLEISLTENF